MSLTDQLAALEAKFSKPEKPKPDPDPKPDNNGYRFDENGDRVILSNMVDWAKQKRLHSRLGNPNPQPAGPTPRGATVAGSSGNRKKRK